MRIGTGYDVHRLKEGRKLILGGVDIPCEMGLDGHSDADVLVHAIMDALLGAAALGDIGLHFPDTEERWKGADSLRLLEHVRDLLLEKGYFVENLDATILAQRPKLRPYIDQMRKNIAEALEIDISQVSVKATTEEGLGFTGEGLGMAAQAVCLLTSPMDMPSGLVYGGGACPAAERDSGCPKAGTGAGGCTRCPVRLQE